MSVADGSGDVGPTDPTPPNMDRTFNLTRWFAVSSALAIGVIALAASWFLTSFLTQRILARESDFLAQFINGIVQVEEADRYFSTAGNDSAGADLEEFHRHLVRVPGTLRANVYAANGRLIWSSDRELVGKAFRDNLELEQALNGIAVWETGLVGADEKDEHVDLPQPGVRFVENYLPVWSTRAGVPYVAGVVELYRTPASLFEALDAGRRDVLVGAAGAAALLFSTLFWIVWRAHRVMRRQQAELLKAQTLAAVGEMASAVAHGLRNPLASIRSSAELALETEAEPETRGLMQEVVAQADRLEDWVRQYLRYACLESGEPEAAPVGQVIERTLDPFAAGLRRRGIEARVEVSPQVSSCRVPPLAVTQILSSLIANAAEAVQEGGHLTIRAEWGPTRRCLRIRVEDDGPGMPKPLLENAFRPFATGKKAGLGVGLPLARQIARRHGGELELATREGAGTTATLFLRAA